MKVLHSRYLKDLASGDMSSAPMTSSGLSSSCADGLPALGFLGEFDCSASTESFLGLPAIGSTDEFLSTTNIS